MLKPLGISLLMLAVSAGGSAQPFTGTFLLANHGETRSALDGAPLLLPLCAPEYPAALKGSGIVGRISVTASINADGSVHSALAGSGNDRRFRESVEAAVRKWWASPPRVDGKAVNAWVRFRVVIPEAAPMEIILGERDSQSPNAKP